MVRGRTASALCVAAVALLAGACGGAPKALAHVHVRAADLLGHWTSDCGSTLTVEPDRTFTVRNFPVDFDLGSGDPKRLASGHGTWHLFPGVKGSTPQTFDLEIGNEFYDLDYVREGDSIALSTVLGAPNNNQWCVFTRRSRT